MAPNSSWLPSGSGCWSSVLFCCSGPATDATEWRLADLVGEGFVAAAVLRRSMLRARSITRLGLCSVAAGAAELLTGATLAALAAGLLPGSGLAEALAPLTRKLSISSCVIIRTQTCTSWHASIGWQHWRQCAHADLAGKAATIVPATSGRCHVTEWP